MLNLLNEKYNFILTKYKNRIENENKKEELGLYYLLKTKKEELFIQTIVSNYNKTKKELLALVERSLYMVDGVNEALLAILECNELFFEVLLSMKDEKFFTFPTINELNVLDLELYDSSECMSFTLSGLFIDKLEYYWLEEMNRTCNYDYGKKQIMETLYTNGVIHCKKMKEVDKIIVDAIRKFLSC